MERRDLLPGVRPDACPPRVVFTTRKAISRARIRANLRDAAQILLLAGVDYFFTQWPSTHIPTFDRSETVLIVLALNVLVLSHIALSRVVPKWTARRIASTWCLAERARFFEAERRTRSPQ